MQNRKIKVQKLLALWEYYFSSQNLLSNFYVKGYAYYETTAKYGTLECTYFSSILNEIYQKLFDSCFENTKYGLFGSCFSNLMVWFENCAGFYTWRLKQNRDRYNVLHRSQNKLVVAINCWTLASQTLVVTSSILNVDIRNDSFLIIFVPGNYESFLIAD